MISVQIPHSPNIIPRAHDVNSYKQQFFPGKRGPHLISPLTSLDDDVITSEPVQTAEARFGEDLTHGQLGDYTLNYIKIKFS